MTARGRDQVPSGVVTFRQTPPSASSPLSSCGLRPSRATGCGPRLPRSSGAPRARAGLSLLGLLLLTGTGCDALGIGSEPAAPHIIGERPLVLTETFFTEANGHTPPASDEPLAFNVTLAVREGRPTVLLAGRYNLPAVARARYGEDPRHAIYLVSLNTDAQRLHATPVGPAPDAPAGDPMQDEASGERLAGTFNVDVPVALGLPEASAPFEFFLWMDEHVTPRQSFVTPDNETPRVGREVLPISGAALLLERTEGDLPIPGITLTPDPDSTVIRGVVAHDRDAHDLIPMLLLAVERPASRFGYARVVMPTEEGMPRFNYDVDIRHLFFEHEPEGRVWMLGIMADAHSEPVSLLVPERPIPDGGVPNGGVADGGVAAEAPEQAPADPNAAQDAGAAE